MAKHVIFKCPRTGFSVQHRLDDPVDSLDNKFVSVECLACTLVHFVNPATGRVLGQQ